MALKISSGLLEKGAAQLIPINRVLGAACITAGSLTMISRCVYQVFKKPPPSNIESWHVYHLLPDSLPLHHKKIVVGSVAFTLSTVVIYAFFPYLRLFLNTPFLKSFTLQIRQESHYSMTAILGIGVLAGSRFISSCFGINIFRGPLDQLRVRFWGPKNTTTSVETPAALQIQTLNYSSIPEEVWIKYIFPMALNGEYELKSFFNLGRVCKDWKRQLHSQACLVPTTPYRHFLWQSFQFKFDVIGVVDFFDTFLPKTHQGDGLRLPLRLLRTRHYNNITIAQLSYIAYRFPHAALDGITLLLEGDDNIEEAARLLNNYLEKGKIYRLSIAPVEKRDLPLTEFLGTVLSPQECYRRSSRASFYSLLFPSNVWRPHNLKTSPFNFKRYYIQVIRLLSHLKGRVYILDIEFIPKEDGLDPIQLVDLLKSRAENNFLTVWKLVFSRYRKPLPKELGKTSSWDPAFERLNSLPLPLNARDTFIDKDQLEEGSQKPKEMLIYN